jgi:crotonobetainyl-CoA:carnitine CoA-transferase CaiB-like acyl-CoA transferase
VKVLGLGQILAGPYCTRLLADAGAEVIKIESPTGDPSRVLPPRIGEQHSGYFANLNAGKLSVTADLRDPAGIELVRSLAAESDVLVENMRPGSLAAKGLDYPSLSAANPGLIMASISAFGNTGAFAGRPGQGIVAEGYSGVIDMTGALDGPPLPLGVSLADVSAGIHAYAAIVTALYRRDRGDGIGEYIDVALFDAALPFHETAFLEVEVDGADVNPTRNGADHRAVVPYGVYDAGDGYIVVAAGTDRLWQRLAGLLGDDIATASDLSTNQSRLAHRAEVTRSIESWASRAGGRDKALAALQAAGIPAGPVRRVNEVAATEPARSRRSFARVPDPVRGDIAIVNTPFKMSRSTVGPAGPAPRLGQHTDYIASRLRKKEQ